MRSVISLSVILLSVTVLIGAYISNLISLTGWSKCLLMKWLFSRIWDDEMTRQEVCSWPPCTRSLGQISCFWKFKIIYDYKKQAILMRRSRVLSFPPQFVFLACTITSSFVVSWSVCHRLSFLSRSNFLAERGYLKVELHSKGGLPALPTNIRQGWKWTSVANTLAYHDAATIMVAKKKIYTKWLLGPML
jgi:hypothetical protein